MMNRRSLIGVVFAVLVILGSFAVRELYLEAQIVEKILGGPRILLFWAVALSIFHRIDTWWSKEDSDGAKNRSVSSIRSSKTMLLLLLTTLFCVLVFVSLAYIDGWAFVLLWIGVFIALWIIGLIAERNRRT